MSIEMFQIPGRTFPTPVSDLKVIDPTSNYYRAFSYLNKISPKWADNIEIRVVEDLANAFVFRDMNDAGKRIFGGNKSLVLLPKILEQDILENILPYSDMPNGKSSKFVTSNGLTSKDPYSFIFFHEIGHLRDKTFNEESQLRDQAILKEKVEEVLTQKAGMPHAEWFQELNKLYESGEEEKALSALKGIGIDIDKITATEYSGKQKLLESELKKVGETDRLYREGKLESFADNWANRMLNKMHTGNVRSNIASLTTATAESLGVDIQQVPVSGQVKKKSFFERIAEGLRERGYVKTLPKNPVSSISNILKNNSGKYQIRAALAIAALGGAIAGGPKLLHSDFFHGLVTDSTIGNVSKLSSQEAKRVASKSFPALYMEAKKAGLPIPKTLPVMYSVKDYELGGIASHSFTSGDYIHLNADISPKKFEQYAGHELRHIFQGEGYGGMKKFENGVGLFSHVEAVGETARERYLNNYFERDATAFEERFSTMSIPEDIKNEALEYLKKMPYGSKSAIGTATGPSGRFANTVALSTPTNVSRNVSKANGIKSSGYKMLSKIMKFMK